MDMSCTKCCFFSQSHGDKVCGGLWPKAGGNHGRDQVHGDAGLLCARTGTQCGTAGQFLAVSASVCLPYTGTAGRFLPVSASVCLPLTLVSHIIKLFFSFLDHAVCLLFRLFKPACWCLCRLSDQIDVLDYLSCLRCACIQCAFFFFKAFDERGFELFWSVQVQHFEQSPIYINHLQNYFFFIWAFIQTMACLQTYTSERQTGWLVLPLSWSDVQV